MQIKKIVISYEHSVNHPWLAPVCSERKECLPVNAGDKRRLKKYRDKIRTNEWTLNSNLKIQHLARKLGVPVRELSSLINRVSGSNFNDFINEIRIEQAKHLFMSSDMKIVDVLNTVGFNSQSVFYKHFIRIEGITPARYCRENQPLRSKD